MPKEKGYRRHHYNMLDRGSTKPVEKHASDALYTLTNTEEHRSVTNVSLL